jgi:hypothetical protein
MRRYTKKELAYLEHWYRRWRVPELTEHFNRRFNHRATCTGIKSTLQNHRYLCGRPPGYRTGEHCIFTKREIRFLERWYPRLSLNDLFAAFKKKYGYAGGPDRLKSFISRKRIHSGRTGCFPKGHVPANKGKKGQHHGSCTSFKKGHRPENWVPCGSERIAADGYTRVKVRGRDRNFPTHKCHWIEKHVLLWERQHGKQPRGTAILFKDGDKRNFHPTNLVCVTRNELARLNQEGYSYLRKELKPSAFAIIKLKIKMFEKMTAAW